ncbi:MAG: hypothetical protein K6G52_08045 [Treponemataceae bacterium]|nr:hypothetical protein [Treponemataceae bacterium]
MNEQTEWLSQQIFSRYGEIKRARGPFLYTEKNVRLTDMYQEAGRAILGWEGGKARLVFKNTLERGQTGSFTTHFDHQLEKACKTLFPEFNSFCFIPSQKKSCLPVWKPWLTELDEKVIFESDEFVFVPPFPFASDCLILCSKQNSILEEKANVNPALKAAIARSVFDLIAEIPKRTEKDFALFDKTLSKYFVRKGPYLYPMCTPQEYPDFVKFCLDNNVVVSPDYESPSIIPYGADYGVLKNLRKA